MIKPAVMNPRRRLQLNKLGIIITSWLVIGFLITCYDYFAVESALSRGTSAHFDFNRHLLLSLTAALLGALMGGSFLVFFVNERYRDKPYWFTVLAVAVSLVLVVGIITVMLAVVAALWQTGHWISHPGSKAVFLKVLGDPLHLKNIIVWSPVVALTQIMLQFNTKFGEGNMWSMISGKYQTPRNEQRIFMFADLNDSTGIAEKLGDELYHQLLKDFFGHITNPILDNKGEIYQYVGDEVIVSWKMADGTENNRCLTCFFDMKRQIERNSGYYQQRYGLVPWFKAGIHCGGVVAGEVGIIKRDITFSGDVLNTASRILGMCKNYGTDFIASATLLGYLQLSGSYTTRKLGVIQLRGREQAVELHAVTPPVR